VYVQTGVSRKLTEPGDARDDHPVWTPEGDRILYVREHEAGTECEECPLRRQLRVVRVDDGHDEILLDHIGDVVYRPPVDSGRSEGGGQP
jgi:hypothetical protein